MHGDEHHQVLHVELSKRVTVEHPYRLVLLVAQDLRKRVRAMLTERWSQENGL
ncbi:hypothetical protein D3C81_2044000 [compost metagenome]